MCRNDITKYAWDGKLLCIVLWREHLAFRCAEVRVPPSYVLGYTIVDSFIGKTFRIFQNLAGPKLQP